MVTYKSKKSKFTSFCLVRLEGNQRCFGLLNLYDVLLKKNYAMKSMYVFRGYRVCYWVCQSKNAGIIFDSLSFIKASRSKNCDM